MSLVRAHGRKQRYRNTCRRLALARLGPCVSRSASSPSRETALSKARPIPRPTSGPLVLLENEIEDLLGFQPSEVCVCEAVERLVEALSDAVRDRTREEELPQLGRRFRRHRPASVHALDDEAEAADDLKGMEGRTVAAVPTLHDFQEAGGIRVVAVELQMDDAVGQVHRDDG